VEHESSGKSTTQGERRKMQNSILVGKSEGKRPQKKLDVEGKIIFEWILRK